MALVSADPIAAVTPSVDSPADRSFLFFGRKKKKNVQADTTATRSEYERFTDAATVSEGMFNVLRKDKDYYFEIPSSMLARDFLVVNKLVRVPLELNEAGVNTGINSSNKAVRFELDKERKKLFAREFRVQPDVPEGDAIARSVEQNYIMPVIASFDIETYNNDSTAVVVKVTDLFNGNNGVFGDIFNDINLGTSAKSDLSRIKSVKAFRDNVYAVSELTTRVVEGNASVYVTVEVGTSIVALPEKPMARRYVSPRVGYFHEGTISYSDDQQRVDPRNYITRWRLEPKPEDVQAYLSGQLVEPVKPIVFHIDNSTPRKWRPYIRQGIEDWNSAFEDAGFRNAVQVVQIPDTAEVDTDDISYSTLTYAASTKSNAMGPSVCDPRSGEIIEADIIWWHNVLDILHDWIVVQTGAVDPEARTLHLPDRLIGDAMRFVACHEVGHSLGLRHNMMASAAVPTDSLRDRDFMNRFGATSSSIMDYARFNYVAQPGDGVEVLSPHIGPYDRMAIEYGYRWTGLDDPRQDYAMISDRIDRRYQGDLYRYSEAQDSRDPIDPRALSEDLGDDAVKSASYGIANLRRIVPNIVAWTADSTERRQDYDDASNLLYSAISQWQRYINHVMANIGGIYVDNNDRSRGGAPTYTHVPRKVQKEALQFVLDNAFTHPGWLFDSDATRYTYLVQNTPVGRMEHSPAYILKNTQSYFMWDLLSDHRLIRMYENEALNGRDAFTPSEMMDMLHRHIFASTIAGRDPDLRERTVQKNFVDALMIAANENEGLKGGKKSLADDCAAADDEVLSVVSFLNERNLDCPSCRHAAGARTAGRRNVNFYSPYASRVSDAISVKRGELLDIRSLLRSRIPSSRGEARAHYVDMLMRINSALGLPQSDR